MRAALEEAGRSWTTDKRGRRRLAALKAVVDTYVPAVQPPAGAPGLGGFWARTASDRGIDVLGAGWIQTQLRDVDRDGLIQLLDLLGVIGFAKLPVQARESLLRTMRGTNDLARGFRGLAELAIGLFYGLPEPDGTNPNWQVLGYPGPPAISPPPDRPRLQTLDPPAGDELELRADVCIIGSGAGGGVIAAVLADRGLDVVILEAGGHFEEHNFPVDEVEAYARMYWRGSWSLSDDGRVKIGAGHTLGGGTTVNWTNCVMPPEWVRAEWANEHGLDDVDTPKFDEHLAAVTTRISATPECSDPNGPNLRMEEGAAALGWSSVCALRNTDRSTYDPVTAGHMGFGDRSGSKQGALNTFLLDANQAGAKILVNTTAGRVTTSGGRATGVEGEMTVGDRRVKVTVAAPTVVVAAGALETPAVLLRSEIGGPAVGKNLRLHPVVPVIGLYPDDQDAWWGAPHTRIIDEFASTDDDYGFLIEGLQYGPGYFSGSLPWYGGRRHKVVMSGIRRASSLIGLVRDRGGGTVTIDDEGTSVVSYPVDDPHDRMRLSQALHATAALHEAAGATGILDMTPGKMMLWRKGKSLDAFLAKSDTIPFHLPHRVIGSAHQMGSARMGTDRATSVADPQGRVHTTKGVWIGDTSAFPTASGVNPMVTCMALAHRTAHAILAEVR